MPSSTLRIRVPRPQDLRVPIHGVCARTLLYSLWYHQRPAPALQDLKLTVPFDWDKVDAALKEGEVDYFCGRAIKTDFRHSSVNPTDYDRCAGVSGAFAVAVLTAKMWCVQGK